MALTGLTAMRRRLIGHLSKGYRQRTGMAQALCGDPDILVLDEPTVGLDPKQVTEMRALIRELGKGRTILFSSHILSEVQQLCDHVVILDHGEIKLDRDLSAMRSPEEITLRCVLAAPESRMLDGLRDVDGVCRVEAQPHAQPEETSVLITFRHASDPERRLFAFAAGRKIPILHLSRCEDSLEQVFLSAISG